MQQDLPDIVLASSSPRRRELLEQAGVRFCVLAPGADEHVDPSLAPAQQATQVAQRKAQAALDALGGDDAFPVVACDTIVVCHGQVFGKPADAACAVRMLRALSGTTHQVISGVCMCWGGGQKVFSTTTNVTFEQLTNGQIDEYVAREQPFDKAGAYAIQGPAKTFVASCQGSYANVVGLPTEHVLDELRAIAVQMRQRGQALSMDKPALRARLKAVRKAMGPHQRQQASQQVCRHIVQSEHFTRARVVAAFRPFGTELAFDGLVRAWPAEKTLCVPVSMAGRRMEFVAVNPQSILPQASELDFLANPYGITQMPPGFDVVDAGQIDLMLVPGLGFDSQGFRIGYGGGYYDTYQKRTGFRAQCLGTFFDEQWVGGGLPHDANDVALPAVVTQSGIRCFGAGGAGHVR